MEGVDDHARAPSGGESDFETRAELYALEGQFGRSEDSQLTFGQATNRLVDGWWRALCWVEGPIPLLPVRISRKVDSRLTAQPGNHPNLAHGFRIDRMQRRLCIFSRHAHVTSPFSQVGVSVSTGCDQ